MKMKPVLSFSLALAAFVLAAGAVLWALRFIHSGTTMEPVAVAQPSPLFEPGDRPTTVFIKGVDVESGKMLNMAAPIRQSKDRVNQMKQAVLAYLQGTREGKVQVPVPEGMGLNEFYFTPAGAAVVDLSTSKVKKEKVGFYEEALFVRGLIETLTGNFFEVKQVKILVEGQDQPTLLGHYALGTSEAALPVPENGNFKF